VRRALLIILGGGIFLGVFLLRTFPTRTAPAPRAPARSAVAAPTVAPRPVFTESARSKPAPVAVAPLEEPSGRPAHGLAPPKPDGNVIEIRIIDGLGIAYGDQIVGVVDNPGDLKRARAEANTPRLWEHPQIPYAVEDDLPNAAQVTLAVQYFKQHTPVEFVPYSGEPDAVVFQKGTTACYSYLGRVGGLQPIKLAPNCRWQEIVHELMHALGFVHEQSRTDRDSYVDIVWTNIEDEYRPQYAQVPESFEEALRGAPFDYHSAMMYRTDEFALTPSEPTMRTRGADTIAPVTDGLSAEDIRRLYRMYQPQDVPQ
jgi:hypothetical protein